MCSCHLSSKTKLYLLFSYELGMFISLLKMAKIKGSCPLNFLKLQKVAFDKLMSLLVSIVSYLLKLLVAQSAFFHLSGKLF